MVMLNKGINRVRDLVAADFEKGQLGTGTNSAIASDTDLQTKKVGTDKTLTVEKSDKYIKTTYTNPSTGTLDTYTEYKNFNDSSGYDYDRIVFTGFTQDTTKDFIVIKRYFFRGD